MHLIVVVFSVWESAETVSECVLMAVCVRQHFLGCRSKAAWRLIWFARFTAGGRGIPRLYTRFHWACKSKAAPFTSLRQNCRRTANHNHYRNTNSTLAPVHISSTQIWSLIRSRQDTTCKKDLFSCTCTLNLKWLKYNCITLWIWICGVVWCVRMWWR